MYTSTQDFTLSCAAGSTGASVVRSATATSLVSQRDAYLKAYGMARALAVEWLECTLDPVTPATIYYNVSKTATVNNTAGHVTQAFTVTISAGSVYSLVSQAQADAAAQTAATVQATQARDVGQRVIYYCVQKTASGACSADYVPYSATITVTAGSITSETSQAAADAAAQASANAQLATALGTNCIRLYQSVAVTASAACSGGLVGDIVTVNYPVGQVATTASQSAADSLAQSGALSVAIATIACASGFYNTAQGAAVNCVPLYGACYSGGVSSAAISAGVYHASSLSLANSTALSAATSKAVSSITCFYIC